MGTEINDVLSEYLTSHTISSCVDVIDLYKVYSELNITNLAELVASPENFKNFLYENIGKIKADDPSSQTRLPLTIAKSIDILKRRTSLLVSPEQEKYANIVNILSGRNSSARILDIGPGKIPASSIILGQNHNIVTAMDSNFDIAETTLSRLHVKPVTAYFKKETPIEEFDIITGNKPCSAIESIVQACAKANKPYYIELCSCDVPYRAHMGDKHNYPAFGWENILPEYDSHIKFSGPIAYNIDATANQMNTLLNEAKIASHGAELSVARRNTYGGITTYEADSKTAQWTPEPETTSTPSTTEDKNPQQSLFDDLQLELFG